MKYKCKVVCPVWLLRTVALLVDICITDAELRGSTVNSAGNFKSCLCRCFDLQGLYMVPLHSCWSVVLTHV